jgi:hypothetical protein
MKLITVTKYRVCSIELPDDDQTLPEMCEVYEDLLRSMGYHFDGTVRVEEDIPNAPEID